MKFGPTPVGAAEGGITVHSIRRPDLVLKKGTVIGKPEIAALQAPASPLNSLPTLCLDGNNPSGHAGGESRSAGSMRIARRQRLNPFRLNRPGLAGFRSHYFTSINSISNTSPAFGGMGPPGVP